MARHHTPVFARPRALLLTLALAAGGLGSVGLTAQSASADNSDQLVVVDTTNAATQGLSGATIVTVNADGSATNTKPVPLPTADAGAAKAFTLSGDSNGNGALALSADATSLSVGGYHAVPGPTGVAGVPDPKDTTAAQIQRMVATISTSGGAAAVDTSTILGTNTLSGSAPRAAVSADGQSFYVSGNGGSDTPKAGVVKVTLGGGSKTQITDANQTNVRQVQIAGGQLYATSDKKNLFGFGRFASAGLPTAPTAITQLDTTPIVGATVPSKNYVPDAMLLLHTGINSSSSTVIDTAYVVIDTDLNNSITGEIRKYTSTNGTTWTKQATAKIGDYPFLTGRVSGGKVQLYLTKGSGTANSVVEVDDTTPTGDFTAGAETTVATAAAGHSFRGVSLPPTGWNPGTVVTAAPTISTDNSSVGGTISDANNPTQDVNLVDSDTPAANLTVTATSSNTAVLPNANITFTGTGATRTATFAPIAKGRATVTFTVKDPELNIGTTQVFYAASSAPSSASGHYFYESSDLSSAIDVGGGYTLGVSSEDSTLRLYKQNQSGRPVKTFDMGAAAPAGIGNGGGDLEGMTRVGNLLYVIGSHGNNSDGDAKPNRRVLFNAAITGSGASTDVTYIGKYTGLWDALRTWDQANGNRLKFAAGQAQGVPANDPNGFNIEGLEFAPGSTSTAYLGFRSPLITHNGKPDAVIVPVTNADSLVLGGAAPTFGDPIYLDLGGRTIRDIRKNSNDEYLITAQADPPSNPQWKLYAWDGKPAHNPIAVASLADPASSTTGSWESIVSVPTLASGASVSLVADSGDTTYYGDTTHATDESKGLQKSYTDGVTLDTFTPFPTVPQNVAATPSSDGSISVSWDAVASAASYTVTVKDGSTNVAGSPKSVTAPATSTTFSGLTSKTYAVTVTAVNGSGESDPSSPATTVTPNDLIANTSKPVISGTPTVGQQLTTTDGSWSPAAGVSFAYQWYADGVLISGATAKTLDLDAAQAGHTITVVVTGSKSGSASVPATSLATAAVAQAQFFSVAQPTIAGNPQVGQALIASAGSSVPAADSFTYRWFGSSDPSTPIAGETGSTFTPTAAQVGQTITSQVVAHRAGYTDLASAKSDPTGVVDPTAVSNSVKPSITGSPAVDSTLTAHDGTWAPAGVTFSYQWLADGNEIDSATGATFTPTATELGKKITVRVTGTKTNLSPYQAESDETVPVAAAPVVNQTAPVLSGTAREGQQLSTTDGTWTPASGLSYSYQWMADGTAIAGAADASTYTLTSIEVGKVITVEVTASKAGYSDGKKTSNASDAVDPSAVSNTVAPSIPTAAVVGTPITVDTGTWQPSGVAFTYQWLADGSPIAGATSASFTPTVDEFGKKISVTVTGSKGALTSLDKTSNETAPVTTAVVNSSAPVISGQAVEGKTLTTTDGTWTPTPDSYTYVWKSGGNVIAGESTNQLVVPSGAAGSTITVEVTAVKAGYISGVKSSTPTGVVDPSAVSNLTLPSILTAPVVGTQLTADHGTWNPSGVSYAYQWLADGSDIANATSQSFTPTVNETGKKLSVKVTAAKSGLTSASATSAETSAVTGLPPVFGTPTNLTVAGTTASTITVTWTKSTDAVKYRLYIGIGTGTRTKLEVGNVNTATFTGLKPNQAYTIDISAFKSNGTQSAYGPVPRLVGTTALLTAPSDLSPTVRAGTSIAVSWTKVPGVKNYRITYGIGAGKRTTVNLGDVDTYNITGLKHNQAYSIDVASLALDKKTVSPASPRISPSTSALLPPTAFKVTGVTATTVSLSWTKAANAASYRIYYGIGTGVRTRVEVGDVNTATITGLTKGKKYAIDIAAVESDGVGRSSYTPRISATTK